MIVIPDAKVSRELPPRIPDANISGHPGRYLGIARYVAIDIYGSYLGIREDSLEVAALSVDATLVRCIFAAPVVG